MSAAIQLAEYSNEETQAAFPSRLRLQEATPEAYELAVQALEALLESLVASDAQGAFYSAVRVNLKALENALLHVRASAPVSTSHAQGHDDQGLSDRAELLADALATDAEREEVLRMFVLGTRALERALSWNQGPISTAALWEKLLTFEVCRCVLVYSSFRNRVLSVPLLRQICQLALVNAENAALELWPLEDEENDEEQPA